MFNKAALSRPGGAWTAEVSHAPHHPTAPIPPPGTALGQTLLQLGYKNLPLLRPEIFLDFQKVMNLLFFQAYLKAADFPDLDLHRRPVGQPVLLDESKQFQALLRQLPLQLTDFATMLRGHFSESLVLLAIQVELPH